MSQPAAPSPNRSSRKRTILLVLLLLLLALLALLLGRCKKQPTTPPPPTPSAPSPIPAAPAPTPAASTAGPAEILTPATIQVPAQIVAGTAFTASWTGPNNPGDHLTLARIDTPATSYETYADTKHGPSLELTAPVTPGSYEVRYVAIRSKNILGRAPLLVTPATASLSAVDEAILNTPVSIAWTGPDNKGDFITIVASGSHDGAYGPYTETAKGSPITVTSLAIAGDSEIRYVTGTGRKVLARRPLKITSPETSVTAPSEAVAGTPVSVTWIGLNTRGDYLTIVPPDAPAHVYQNYTDAGKGSPLTVTAPIEPGAYELRYVAGQGKNVLARRPIKIVPAEIGLDAPDQAATGASVSVQWTGPNNKGDYLTIVVKGTRDGEYAHYADTHRGTPATIKAPAKPGPAEIRYMSGQGAKVLARRPIEIAP